LQAEQLKKEATDILQVCSHNKVLIYKAFDLEKKDSLFGGPVGK